ncbi:MAG: NAD(+)/NADH kinase [Brevinema sp.]
MPKALITGKTKIDKFRYIFNALKKELSNIGIESLELNPEDQIPANVDFDIIFCIGGDGNFIAAARKFVDSGKPLIGINAGTLGFLPNINPPEIPTKVPLLFKQNIKWTKRLMVMGSTQNHQLCALNEFLFSNVQKGILSQFTIFIDNHKVMSIRSDGLLIATATGSTAYNLSAGGPIAMPEMDILLITPICSHILGERPLVVGLNSHIKIVNCSNMEYSVWADGQVSIPFLKNDEFVIQTPKYIDTHPLQSSEFFETLAMKLGWSHHNLIEK